MDDMKSRNQ